MKLLKFITLALALAASARAQLVMTIKSHLVETMGSHLQIGDEVVTTYTATSPISDLNGDGSFFGWSEMKLLITSGSTTILDTSLAGAGFINSGSAFGFIGAWADQGLMFEFLTALDGSVLENGILKNGVPISSFDSPMGAFNDYSSTLVWEIDSYEVSGDLLPPPTSSPVPEPSTFGFLAGAALLAGAACRRRRKAYV